MITLPEFCGARARAQEVASTLAFELSPIISFEKVESIAQGFIDELCKELVNRRVDRVTFIGPSETFMDYFMRAYRLRSARFLVETR